MPIFKYIARDTKPGTRSSSDVSGYIKARNVAHAEAKLIKKFLYPREIKEETTYTRLERLKGVSIDDCIMFCRQAETLLASGVSIVDSLDTLTKISTNPYLKAMLWKCHTKTKEGYPLSTFFVGNKSFPPIIGTMLQIGEETGNIAESFKLLAEQFEFQQDNQRRVKEALNKPKQLLTTMVIVMTLMLVFVIPELLKTFDGPVPLPTRIVLFASNALIDHWAVIILVIFNTYVCIRFWLSKGGALIWDKHKNKVPALGSIWQKYEMIVFTRTCAMMVDAGITYMDTLPIAAKACGNKYVMQRVDIMVLNLQNGVSIGQSAVSANVFPLIVETMIIVGDQTGSLSKTMLSIATYYKREIDFDLKIFSEKLQPYILYVSGGAVLLIVLAVYMPMLENLVALIK